VKNKLVAFLICLYHTREVEGQAQSQAWVPKLETNRSTQNDSRINLHEHGSNEAVQYLLVRNFSSDTKLLRV